LTNIPGLYEGIILKRKSIPKIKAITDPIPHAKKTPKAPNDTRNIGIGIFDVPNIDSFMRTYFDVLFEMNTLFNNVVATNIPVNAIKRVANKSSCFKNKSFGDQISSPNKNIAEITKAAIRHNVKHELIVSFFSSEFGRNRMSATLNPSRESIANRFIEDMIVDASPTSSDA
jgi:hypothetical protein